MHIDTLTPPEQRVLGCLIEKRFTTPDQYPLTLNALRLRVISPPTATPSSTTTRRRCAQPRSAWRSTGWRGSRAATRAARPNTGTWPRRRSGWGASSWPCCRCCCCAGRRRPASSRAAPSASCSGSRWPTVEQVLAELIERGYVATARAAPRPEGGALRAGARRGAGWERLRGAGGSADGGANAKRRRSRAHAIEWFFGGRCGGDE